MKDQANSKPKRKQNETSGKQNQRPRRELNSNQDLTKQKVITLKNEFKEKKDEIKANKTGVKGTIQDSRGKISKK